LTARTGRRPGHSGTREAILDAARRSFAEQGYDRATIRGIARGAGVDPALVHHFYGTKEKLFAAAVGFPVVPSELLGQIRERDREDFGEALVRALLQVWDADDNAGKIAALLRSALTSEPMMDMLRQFVASAILGVVAAASGHGDAAFRASLVGSQVIGLAMARYVVRIGPLADAPAEEIATAVGPTLQRYLTGRLS
jgi:AcrR family transcriptional regulator